MKLTKTLITLTFLSLAGSAGLAFGQDNVLDAARQKYDRSKTAETTDAATAEPESPAEPTMLTPDDEAAATSSTSVTSEDQTITVDVDVRVKVKPNKAGKAAKDKPAEVAQPAEPKAEKPASVEKPAKAERARFMVFQFVPGLPRNTLEANAVFAVSPIMVSVHSVRVLEFGFLLADADVAGGLQLSTLGNLSRESHGLGIAGLFNIGGKVNGIQLSGLFNLAGETKGLQAAGLFNIAGNDTGIQTAGLFNIARNINGVQAAGLFNIAGDVNGVQIAGLFNGAKKVKGLQIGLINIADDLDGIALGLINYSRTGINEIDTYYESNGMINAAILTGSRHFYSFLQVGENVTDLFKNTDSLNAAIGVGFRVGSNTGFHAQADIGVRSLVAVSTGSAANGDKISALSGKGWSVVERKTVDSFQGISIDPTVAMFPSVRLGLGLNFGRFIGIFAGVTLDINGGEYWSVPTQFQSPVALMVNYNGQQYGAYAKWYAGISVL